MLMNDNFAWILGWAQTDGSFDKERPRIQFRVEPTDIDVLHKIKYLLNDFDNQIFIKPNNEGTGKIAEFKITHRNLYSFKYIKTENPPDFSPSETRSFLRGLFEGDGSLYWDKRCKHNVIEFTNANVNMVDYVNKTISYLLNFPAKDTKIDFKRRFEGKQKKETIPSYRIYWTGRRANLIAWYLWHGNIEDVSLDRKRNLYYCQVLENNLSKIELENLLKAVKCIIIDDKIHINIRGDLTLEWAQRLKHVLCNNATPIILRQNKNKEKIVKYYGLHLPKIIKTNKDSIIYQSIWI